MSDRPDKLYLCDFQGGEVFVNKIDLAMDDRLHNPTMYIKASDLAKLKSKIESVKEQSPYDDIDADIAIQHDQLLTELYNDLEQLIKRG